MKESILRPINTEYLGKLQITNIDYCRLNNEDVYNELLSLGFSKNDLDMKKSKLNYIYNDLVEEKILYEIFSKVIDEEFDKSKLLFTTGQDKAYDASYDSKKIEIKCNTGQKAFIKTHCLDMYGYKSNDGITVNTTDYYLFVNPGVYKERLVFKIRLLSKETLSSLIKNGHPSITDRIIDPKGYQSGAIGFNLNFHSLVGNDGMIGYFPSVSTSQFENRFCFSSNPNEIRRTVGQSFL